MKCVRLTQDELCVELGHLVGGLPKTVDVQLEQWPRRWERAP